MEERRRGRRGRRGGEGGEGGEEERRRGRRGRRGRGEAPVKGKQADKQFEHTPPPTSSLATPYFPPKHPSAFWPSASLTRASGRRCSASVLGYPNSSPPAPIWQLVSSAPADSSHLVRDEAVEGVGVRGERAEEREREGEVSRSKRVAGNQQEEEEENSSCPGEKPQGRGVSCWYASHAPRANNLRDMMSGDDRHEGCSWCRSS
eukprot:758225-Hanusia_phi.AAC.2